MKQSADELKSNPSQSFKTWRPVGMSLLTHLLLVVFFVVWVFSRTEAEPPTELRQVSITLSVKNSEDLLPEYLSESDFLEPSETQAVSQEFAPASPIAPPLDTANSTSAQPDLSGFTLDPSVADANEMVQAASHSRSNRPVELSEDDLKMMESDRKLLRDRAPKGDPATISVFGSGDLTGRSFVFVIDRSKSMGGRGLDVLHFAQNELSNTINQLQPVHQFQIIGYNDRTVSVAKRELLHATEANKNRVAEFIANLVAFGPTYHKNGLMAALAFNPDIIVLMTDGGVPGLTEGELKMIKQLTSERCQIHCVQFGIGSAQQAPHFMTRLTNQNRGTFRYVDVTQWTPRND